MKQGIYKRKHDELVPAIIKHYLESGDSLQKTADKFNVSWAKVRYNLLKYGVKLRNDKFNLSNETIHEMYEKYNEGLSMKQLGSMFLVSEDCVRIAFKKFKLKVRKGNEGCHEFWATEEYKDKCAQKISGSNSPCWKGGSTKLTSTIRCSAKGKLWKLQVIERDNYTCVRCGANKDNTPSVRLTQHHIKELSKIVKEHNIKTSYESRHCAELWDISNGETLCKECHIEHHRLLQIKHGRYCKK